MYGIVKANFNDFLDSDDKHLMLKLVYADINSEFDNGKFNLINVNERKNINYVDEIIINVDSINNNNNNFNDDKGNTHNGSI